MLTLDPTRGFIYVYIYMYICTRTHKLYTRSHKIIPTLNNTYPPPLPCGIMPMLKNFGK